MNVLRRLAAPSLQPFWVLGLSGVAGFRLGYVAFPTWHVAVQSAQVVAGLVRYPPDNPFYIYHTKLWTLLHQLLAPLLLAGFSERQLSLFLSGLLGMLALQALAMFVFAFSRDLLLALGSAFLIFYTRAAEYGVTYPVFLMGTEHTYGSVGLSLSVLIVGLLGAGCWRLGALLLGLMPAVHASIGVWLWLTIGIAAATTFRSARAELRVALPYFGAGAAVMLASLAVQLAFIYDVPAVDADLTRKYLSAFIAFWDGHRQPVDPTAPGVIFNAAALAIAILWLRTLGDRLSLGASIALRIVAASACVGFGCMLLSWMPPDRLPLTLVTLMPARLLNVNAMTFAALQLGLLGASRRRTSSALVMLGLVVALLFSRSSMVWERTGASQPWPAWLGRPDPVIVMEVTAVGLGCIGLVPSLRRRDAVARADRYRWSAGTVRFAALAAMVFASVQSWKLQSRVTLYDRTNDPLFARASQESRGLMAAGGGFHLAQMLTRRPILLNSGALDTMSYAPESAPAMDRILRDVYGIDLFSPPRGIAPGGGAIPDDFNRRMWEGYTRAKWQEIRRTHQVTQVLTSGYELDLPVIAQSRGVRLYSIPDD